MVYNRKDLSRSFSPSKIKKSVKRRMSGDSGTLKPSTSGSTMTAHETGSQNIKVIVRVRPDNEREMQDNYRTVINVVDDKMLIFDPKEEQNPFFYRGVEQKGRNLLKKQNKELQFIFNRVFDQTCTNEDVFRGTTKDIIGSLLEGYNCSVFAYGATGAGKTHTMLGKEIDPGITYRTVAELFIQIEAQSEQRDFNLGVTYLEVYNENVQDLLHKTGPLHIRDDGRCGIIVSNLKVIPIQNAEELLSLLAKGNRNRTQHPTDANKESSRSHAVFQVFINIKNKLDGQVKHVKLSMIDLAGSERAAATGCKGDRFKEGANINKSLLALGNCINKLADGTKHIPYRDSKLTRLLKDSLGGNCQTVMIANVGPSSCSYEDTYNTLRYADRAKKIKTNVKKNIVSCQMHVTGYIKMVEEQKKEIYILKQKLLAMEGGQGGSPPSSDERPMEELDDNLVEMNGRLQELFDKKKALNEKMLSLESADKMFCCRIQYKKAADERLYNLTDDESEEEKNASGKLRLSKSMHHFKRQRDAIRIQMEAVWEELRTVETDLQALYSEIEAKGLANKLERTIALHNSVIECSRERLYREHAKKLNNLQQCELQSLSTMVKTLSAALQKQCNMRGVFGNMTDKMKEEFQKVVKSLEGVRNIRWLDSNSSDDQGDFYKLNCLSIERLMEPLVNEMPALMSLSDDEDQNSQEKLGGTSDTPVGTGNALLPSTLSTRTKDPDTTITLHDKPVESSMMEQSAIAGCSTSGELNSTFNVEETKVKKRALEDNSQSATRPPASKVLKRAPTFKVKTKPTAGAIGKENNNSRKVASVMSAKSIAILNKLKSDKAKLPDPVEFIAPTPTVPLVDANLKVVRNKERRGIGTTHPYHKQNPKPK
ncbi:kinesin-like protein KIF18A [Orussus abietinus]|uniref:kinesin-like protein KIF18A n=1 Tax=Orussus abietinus TaxID=222816 RepID=UPI0006254866|nr:kinesin-like protein KIF18A [Orussus abietinus]